MKSLQKMKISLIILLLLKMFGNISCLDDGINKSSEDVLDVKFLSKQDETNKNSLCPSLKSTNILLSRKRRTISFPDKTAFLITFSLVKAILIGLPLGWNQALEMDVFYPTAGLLEIYSYKYPKLKKLVHRQRRDVWGSFEAILDASGVNGQACILRTICEVQKYLTPTNQNLVHDLLRVLFFAPDVGEDQDIYMTASNSEDCKFSREMEEACPFSLLELILSYEKV